MSHNAPMRLAKYLALTGCCSRRAATRLIRDGRIMIDGRQANHIDTVTIIDSMAGQRSEERLTLDAVVINAVEEKAYWLFHKAVGTDSRLLEQLPCSLLHLLPASPRLYPVGRLDKDSRGLMLLTNDGDLTHQLLHPDFGHSKTYHVQLDREFDALFLQKMAAGVSYKNVTTLPCQLRRLDLDRYEITLTQGLNRQIRRMSQALGYKVIDLKRVAIENLHLASLAEGDMQPLTSEQLTQLFAALSPTR